MAQSVAAWLGFVPHWVVINPLRKPEDVSARRAQQTFPTETATLVSPVVRHHGTIVPGPEWTVMKDRSARLSRGARDLAHAYASRRYPILFYSLLFRWWLPRC